MSQNNGNKTPRVLTPDLFRHSFLKPPKPYLPPLQKPPKQKPPTPQSILKKPSKNFFVNGRRDLTPEEQEGVDIIRRNNEAFLEKKNRKIKEINTPPPPPVTRTRNSGTTAPPYLVVNFPNTNIPHHYVIDNSPRLSPKQIAEYERKIAEKRDSFRNNPKLNNPKLNNPKLKK